MIEEVRLISDTIWHSLYNDLSGIGRYDILRPDLQLVIRHTSGAVFQEAHLEVQLSPNSWLPGFEGPVSIDSRAIPKEAGIYFTPPALARTLAEEATKDIEGGAEGTLLVFDPACGSGELLKECLRLLKLRRYLGSVRVVGWDKSTAAVDMARFVLAWESRSWTADRLQFEIAQQDSLSTMDWPTEVDILVMNPPFKSWLLMGDEERKITTRMFGSSYRPNLALAFAYRSLNALREGGTLAMIAPNSLLESASGRLLRKAIAEVLEPQLIARLGEQSIFSRALVDAGMYVGKKKPTQAATPAVVWADSQPNSLNRALRGLRKWRGAEADPLSDEGFSVYRRDDIGKTGDPWLARDYDAWVSFKRVQRIKCLVPAEKVFDIRQGARLGNDVFIVPKEYFRKLHKSEQKFFRPAVMNISLSNAKIEDSYYVFYRYTKGLPNITSEGELQEHVPTYFNDLLLPAKRRLSARKTLARAKQNWWELLEHRSWQEEYVPKIVSKYFGGKHSFAFDRNGRFVVAVGNAWLIKRGTIAVEITNEEIYFAILTYLSSSVTDELLRYVSIQVSGGAVGPVSQISSQLDCP